MRTKIIATIGPASKDRDTLTQLIENGVRVMRLNFSHGNAESFRDIVKTVRELEVETNIPITLMMDLAGPKIRIGSVNNDIPIEVKAGDRFVIGKKSDPNHSDVPFIPFDVDAVYERMEKDDILIIGDGGMRMRAIECISPTSWIIEAICDGLLASRKGLTLPCKNLPVPALTEKDKKDLREGIALGLDAVALSFVQTPDDVIAAKEIIAECGSDIPVVAKLERRNAVDRLDDILKFADVIMVARGDLGIECDISEVPAIQKKIIAKCNMVHKPVIVATQMLVSMISSPTPTRAEATDVANAVWDGTDCVMMSEETAMGKFPVEATKMMCKIAEHAENAMISRKIHAPNDDASSLEFLAYSTCVLAEKSNAKGIVVYVRSGLTARYLASFRPSQKIYAVSTDLGAVKRLNFTWGIHARKIDLTPGEKHLAAIEHYIDSSHHFETGDVALIASSGKRGSNKYMPTDTIRIYCK